MIVKISNECLLSTYVFNNVKENYRLLHRFFSDSTLGQKFLIEIFFHHFRLKEKITVSHRKLNL